MKKADLSSVKNKDECIVCGRRCKKGEKFCTVCEYLSKFDNKKGYCRVCGKNTTLFSSTRINNIVVGSGKMVNFHHNFESGIFLCPQCLFKIFLVPLAIYQTNSFILVKPNGDNLKSYIKDKIIKPCYLATLSPNGDRGSTKYYIKKCKLNNILYLLANDLIKINERNMKKDRWFEEQISLYQFKNGKEPFLKIIDLPSNVYKFLGSMLGGSNETAESWKKFIYFHYKPYSKLTTNELRHCEWKDEKIFKKGKSIEDIFENSNSIIDRLINGESLIRSIRKYNEKRIYLNKAYLTWEIITKYIKEILNMNSETLATLYEFGKKMSRLLKDSDSKKKILYYIRSSVSRNSFISNIEKIQKKYSISLISLNDLLSKLLPSNQHWLEIRELLLIHLYDLMQKENIDLPDDGIDEIPNDDDITDTQE